MEEWELWSNEAMGQEINPSWVRNSEQKKTLFRTTKYVFSS
jgi:hypothetical protein